MLEITARQIMLSLDDYPRALASQSLRDGMALLDGYQIQRGGQFSMARVLLVFDDDNKLLGLARRRDILRGLEPAYHGEMDAPHPEAHPQQEIDPNLSGLVGPEDIERIERRLNNPLGKVVRQIPGHVAASDPLMKIIRELVGKDTHIVAVVDEYGEVVGVTRSLDVVRAINEALS
jgi:CBS-domain-containing membrane protein